MILILYYTKNSGDLQEEPQTKIKAFEDMLKIIYITTLPHPSPLASGPRIYNTQNVGSMVTDSGIPILAITNWLQI